MNISIYIFGEFQNGYSQYPDDYVSAIFQKFSANAKSQTQIAIHREGNLMYYGYIRKLQQDKYIGFCCVLNALLFKRIDILFSLFENAILELVELGVLIHFNAQGDLVTSVEKLYLNPEEIDLITELLRAKFSAVESLCAPLPPTNYGTSKDSSKDYSIEDDKDDIVKSSYTNGYTYIYKSKGYKARKLNSYRAVFTRVNNEKQELQEQFNELQKEYSKVLKRKKQFTVVIILALVLLASAVGLFSLKDNLNFTRNELFNANETIEMQIDTLEQKSLQIDSLQNENRQLSDNLIVVSKAFIHLEGIVEDSQPIIQNVSFNFNDGYLSFNYFGVTAETIRINVKTYLNNENIRYDSESIDIVQGYNSARIYISDNLDRSERYSFVILKDDVIIGGAEVSED